MLNLVASPWIIASLIIPTSNMRTDLNGNIVPGSTAAQERLDYEISVSSYSQCCLCTSIHFL